MSSAIPDQNNIAGTIIGPVDLDVAVRVLTEEFGVGNVGVYTSGYNGAKTLHVDSETADLEGHTVTDDPGSDYLVTGALAGANADIVSCFSRLVASLKAAGVAAQFEVYDQADEMIYDSRKNGSEQGVDDQRTAAAQLKD
jgi:hypothetical protein